MPHTCVLPFSSPLLHTQDDKAFVCEVTLFDGRSFLGEPSYGERGAKQVTLNQHMMMSLFLNLCCERRLSLSFFAPPVSAP